MKASIQTIPVPAGIPPFFQESPQTHEVQRVRSMIQIMHYRSLSCGTTQRVSVHSCSLTKSDRNTIHGAKQDQRRIISDKTQTMPRPSRSCWLTQGPQISVRYPGPTWSNNYLKLTPPHLISQGRKETSRLGAVIKPQEHRPVVTLKHCAGVQRWT